jgi:hypothetical protein
LFDGICWLRLLSTGGRNHGKEYEEKSAHGFGLLKKVGN